MNRLYSAISWLVTLLVPLALVGLGVRLMLTSAYLSFEYNRPDFPADQFGFTTQDRERWGLSGVDYLLNNAGVSYLGNLTFPDGSPLFNERELSHMHDVKIVAQGFLRIWYAALSILLLVGIWAWRAQWFANYRRGLRRGGWLTLALALVVGLVGTVGASGSGDVFWQFFTDFHGLFFQGQSWLFPDSDTLIRLYPLKFWEDTVLYIGVIAAIGAFACILLPRDIHPNPVVGTEAKG